MILNIIGNGFDLHHGIRSSYFNFKDYLEDNDSDVFEMIEKYLGNTQNFWYSFEQNLAYLDEDSILDHASNYLVSYGADDWSDANHHDYQYEIEQITKPLTSGLQKNFTQWVKQLEISHFKNQLLCFEENSIFLTFNYTSTLEKLYGIDETRILHIHGYVSKEKNELIFGHNYIKPSNNIDLEKIKNELGEEAYYEYVEKLSDGDIRVTEGTEILNSYFTETFKPTEVIITENKVFFEELSKISKITIIGHSLESVDMPYFEEIVNRINSSEVKWFVHYHKQEDVIKHTQILIKLGVKKDLIQNVKIDYFYPSEGVLFSSDDFL